jgi:ankyrin repeat protein
MIDVGSDINHRDEYGYTALLLSVIKGHKETAEMLLKHGAKPDEKDGHGRTALMFAARQGNTGMVHLLLANNADRNVALDAGITAREIAYAAKHKDVVALLEQQIPKR